MTFIQSAAQGLHRMLGDVCTVKQPIGKGVSTIE